MARLRLAAVISLVLFLGLVAWTRGTFQPVNPDSPFEDLGDSPVRISGRILLAEGVSEPQVVDLDLFAPDPLVPGGRRLIGKLKVTTGPFSFLAPANFGPMLIEVMADLDRDGPSPGDPFGVFLGNPLEVKSESVSEIDILLQPM